jgi:Laminin G domain
MRRAVLAGAAAAAGLAVAACGPPPAPPVVIGPPPAAPALVQARWNMNETTGRVMKDSIKPAHDGVIGPAVVIGGGVYDFPGWSGVVDGNGNFTGAPISADGSVVSVADTTHQLEPLNAAFSVDGTLRTRLAATGALPNGAQGTGYNIVQKARASNLGGFWKVEIRGFGNGLGHLQCTLGDGRNVLTAESQARVDDGNWHAFACRLNGNIWSAVVDGVGANVDATILGAVNPVERFSTAVTIGKKPGSTDATDSFSGWLDQLNISAG